MFLNCHAICPGFFGPCTTEKRGLLEGSCEEGTNRYSCHCKSNVLRMEVVVLRGESAQQLRTVKYEFGTEGSMSLPR